MAGGGREHVGYFASEEAGAMAYSRALERLKMQEGALPARAMERYSLEREGLPREGRASWRGQEREARAAAPAPGPAAAAPPLAAPQAASAGPPSRV